MQSKVVSLRAFRASRNPRRYRTISVSIPDDETALARELVEFFEIATDRQLDELKDFFRSEYEFWLQDPEISTDDRAFANDRLRDLSAAPVPSGAREDAVTGASDQLPTS